MSVETKQAKNPWVTNESGLKVFWARAEAAGLDRENVHELFGVDTMYDYEGTLQEAIKTIENWQATQEPPLQQHQHQTDPQPLPPDPEPAPDPEQAAGQARALFEASQALPEAGALAWTKVQSKKGFVWSFTVRAGLEPEQGRTALRQLMEQVKLFEDGVEKMGWLPVSNGHDLTHLPIPTPATAPAPPQTGAAPPVAEGHQGFPASPPQERGNGASGTAPLRKITVDADGRVEFYVGKFKYPFKDGRGAEVVAGLFDEGLGWTAEHFTPGAKYEADALAGLHVDWEKPGKYYDVVRVHR